MQKNVLQGASVTIGKDKSISVELSQELYLNQSKRFSAKPARSLTQVEFFGLQLRNRLNSKCAMGAIPMGAPGWPEFALLTVSTASVRIVLMHSSSFSSCNPVHGYPSVSFHAVQYSYQYHVHLSKSHVGLPLFLTICVQLC